MKATQSSRFDVRRMVAVALFGAMAFVLMFFDIPTPFAAFLKIDFSEIPALIGLVIYGPYAAIAIVALKVVLHLLIVNPSLLGLISDGSNFLAALAIILPYAAVLRRRVGTLNQKLGVGMVLSTVSITVIMAVLNYFVLMPAYVALMNFHLSVPLAHYVLLAVVPFNLVKGLLLGGIFWLLASHMTGWLTKQSQK